MSSPTPLAGVRAALAAVLAQVSPAITVYPYYVENPQPPCALVETTPGVVEAFATFDGSMDFQMRVVLLSGSADQPTAQAQLDSWIDRTNASGPLALLMANERLGGACQYCIPTRVGSAPAGGAIHGYQLIEWAGLQYVGTNIILDVVL